MVRLITLLLLGQLTLVLAGQAQTVYYLAPPKPPAPQSPGAAYVARVIDARLQRDHVGMITGSAESAPIKLKENLESLLQRALIEYAPGQTGAVPLTLRVLYLELSQMPVPAASLVADLYAPQPDSSYRLVRHLALSRSRRKGDKLQGALADVLAEVALKARDQSGWRTPAATVPVAYVRGSLHPAERLPLLEPTTQPRAGIYNTLEELWYNQPSELGRPELEAHPPRRSEWAGDTAFVPLERHPNGSRSPKLDCWGFSDGRYWYVRFDDGFSRLLRRGEGFMFYGLSGSLDGTPVAGIPTTIGTTTFMRQPNQRRIALGFNALTGGATPNPGLVPPPLAARPANVFVYRPRGVKGPPVRIQLAADQPAQELAAGEYVLFSPMADQPVQLTLLAASQTTYLPITPTSQAALYVECRPAEAAPLREVKEREGAAAVARLLR